MSIALPITSDFLPKKNFKRPIKASYEEFKDIQEQYPEYRFEYDNGYIIPMTGGTNNHSSLILSIGSFCKNHLRNANCKAFIEPNLKVGNNEYFPDVAVDCNSNRPLKYIEYPILVVEVLSASTKKYDMRRKLEVYKSIESIQEIFYIEQDSKDILVYRRNLNSKIWEEERYLEGEIVEFKSIGLSVPIDEIYTDVVLD